MGEETYLKKQMSSSRRKVVGIMKWLMEDLTGYEKIRRDYELVRTRTLAKKRAKNELIF